MGSASLRGGETSERNLAVAWDDGRDLEDVHAAAGQQGDGEELRRATYSGNAAGEPDGVLAAGAEGDGGTSSSGAETTFVIFFRFP